MATQRFAVIGLGRFGQYLARALTSINSDVIGIDRDADLVERVRDQITLAVRLDSTDLEALTAQGVGDVDVAIVGIGQDFESAALTVANLKQLGVPRIIARAQTDVQARILTSVGAHQVAAPERESAERWAHRLTLPDLTQYVELGEGHTMIHTVAPKPMHHQTPTALDLRNKFGLNLIAIERQVAVHAGADAAATPTRVIEIPTAETTILPDDVLVLVGSNESLAKLPRS